MKEHLGASGEANLAAIRLKRAASTISPRSILAWVTARSNTAQSIPRGPSARPSIRAAGGPGHRFLVHSSRRSARSRSRCAWRARPWRPCAPQNTVRSGMCASRLDEKLQSGCRTGTSAFARFSLQSMAGLLLTPPLGRWRGAPGGWAARLSGSSGMGGGTEPGARLPPAAWRVRVHMPGRLQQCTLPKICRQSHVMLSTVH